VRDLGDELVLLLGQNMSEGSKADGHLEGGVKRHRQHMAPHEVDAGVPRRLVCPPACHLQHPSTDVNADYPVAT
jgi:hypothetical protein